MAPELAEDSNAEVLIAERWANEVAVEANSAEANSSEPPHGPTKRWPRYGHIAAGLKVDGVALANELRDLPPEHRMAERELKSNDGRLRGTADLIVIDRDGNALVIDHKMGAVGDDDLEQGGRYGQQLLLYAAMARDSGIPASSAEIRPIGQPPIPLDLSDDRLAAAVEEAHKQMERYNNAVAAGNELELATPSESSCGWCPYILDCPAIWSGNPLDLGESQCIEGEVTEVQILPTSAAASIRTGETDVIASGLPTHDVSGRRPQPGANVRITGLRQASTGRLRAGYRTLYRLLE